MSNIENLDRVFRTGSITLDTGKTRRNLISAYETEGYIILAFATISMLAMLLCIMALAIDGQHMTNSEKTGWLIGLVTSGIFSGVLLERLMKIMRRITALQSGWK